MKTKQRQKIADFSGTYEFLSNFCKSPIEFMGNEYDTVEHFYQAAKAADAIEAIEVAGCRTPGMAKKKGRRIGMRADWAYVKIPVMRLALVLKFQDPELREKLLATGDAELIEGNTWGDVFWGVDVRTGHGENHLGILLMELRDELRQD